MHRLKDQKILHKKFLTETTLYWCIVFFVFNIIVMGALAYFLVRDMRCEHSYQFINAKVACGSSPVLNKKDYVATENEVSAFIDREKAAGRLTDAAVYFRDLRNGPIFGVNETADYAPASLLKVPIALVYLTQAERHPEILQQQLFIAQSEALAQNFQPTKTITPGTSYTTLEILAAMLVYSDNNAYQLLYEHLLKTGQQGVMTQTFLELGFLDPANLLDETLSVRQYAGILRLLYNASFLNAELSEKMLGWLAQSDFTQGIVGGVPEGVVVAHKFGERVAPDGKGGEKEGVIGQLHDCGIIYYPGNPYLLCIMTRGKNFADLAAAIRHISATVYQEVNSRRL